MWLSQKKKELGWGGWNLTFTVEHPKPSEMADGKHFHLTVWKSYLTLEPDSQQSQSTRAADTGDYWSISVWEARKNTGNFFLISKQLGLGVDRLIWAPTAKPRDLSFIPRTPMVNGRTNSCKVSSDFDAHNKMNKWWIVIMFSLKTACRI